MSLLDKLIGRSSGDEYSRGIALYEEGHYREAVPLLRPEGRKVRKSEGSLSDFYLRQSLTREGKRLLAHGDARDSLPYFEEAVQRWPVFPDLQFWLGIARARSGLWNDALGSVQQALSFNPDYIEARLLEACALKEMGDPTSAAESLNALLASGKRVEHPLIRFLAAKGPYSESSIPEDLFSLLHESADRETNRNEISAAVEQCRTGRWDEGIRRLRELCAEHPTYPDLRIKLAGALFQTGNNMEALTEIEQALVLNPRYRTAAHLKALVLADQHRFSEARDVVLAQATLTDPVVGHPGEELFCSYLGSVLSMLTGRLEEARSQLEKWGDLTASFPRAELLRAATYCFSGEPEVTLGRLRALVKAWPTDLEYNFHLACLYLENRELDALSALLDAWPPLHTVGDACSEQLAYLRAHLSIARKSPLGDAHFPEDVAHTPAWRFLKARSLALEGSWNACLQEIRSLTRDDVVTEPLSALALRVYLAVENAEEVVLPDAVSDDLLAMRVFLLHRQEKATQALKMIECHQELHRENLRWLWLDPNFWLEPIRRWIG